MNAMTKNSLLSNKIKFRIGLIILFFSITNLLAQEIDRRCKTIYDELVFKDSLLKKSNSKLDSVLRVNENLNNEKKELINSIELFRKEIQLLKIGNQKWDNSNLMVKALNDGTPIFYADTRQKWDSLFSNHIPAYCIHKNDSTNSFGFIYNYYAVTSGKLAPEGMRVPKKSDFDELIRFTHAVNGKGASLLKSNDSTSLNLPKWKTKGLDIFEMGIRPCGFRLDDAKEWYFGNKLYYWCQSESLNKILLMAITEINDDPFLLEKELEQKNSNYGLYVRCIKQ
jgi:uncharacterized protein (TIGR02145 family)